MKLTKKNLRNVVITLFIILITIFMNNELDHAIKCGCGCALVTSQTKEDIIECDKICNITCLKDTEWRI